MNSKGKIVLIEDEKDLRETLAELLEISGYEVAAAPNGKEGCALIFELLPELVICDINMPKMNGYEVLSTINSRLEGDLTPAFLFLTARVQLEDIKQGLKLGADDYIAKPFVTTDLLASVEMRLAKRRKLLNHLQPPAGADNGSVQGQKGLGKLALPIDKGIRYVAFNDILKCEADRAYCVFHLSNNEKIMVSKSMSEFEEVLNQNGFLRVHKSTMVNTRYVDTYVRGKGGYLVLTDGSHVNVSVRKKEEVITTLRS